jgi:beta-galactosidase
MSILRQMYSALYDLNVESDFVRAGDTLSGYRVLLVPPLYSASDAVLQQIADYVKNGGEVVMAFKSGFADEHSTVRWTMAPGPLREAAGFHYQEFTSLAEPLSLAPDPYNVGAENTGSVWAEFLIPDTAKVVASYSHPYWHFPAVTRNSYGKGTLTYEGTVVSDTLQREIVRDALKRAGLSSADQDLQEAVRVRHGRDPQGKRLHYYLNFSGQGQSVSYRYASGSDLLTNGPVEHGGALILKPWDLAIVAED